MSESIRIGYLVECIGTGLGCGFMVAAYPNPWLVIGFAVFVAFCFNWAVVGARLVLDGKR